MEKRIASNLNPLENTKFYYMLARADHWHSLHRPKEEKKPVTTSTGNVSEYSNEILIYGFSND